MKYVNLGRTGVKVSQLCLGTMNFGSRTEEAEAVRMVHAALDGGVNFIDTANRYGDAGEGVGRSEEMIGKALAENGRRHRVVLATKVYYHMDRDDPNGGGDSGLSRRHIIAECENSLRRLQTDHIDLYQLHQSVNHIPIDETLRALDDLIRAGKVRYIGVSGFPAWKLMQALWTSKELRLNRFVSSMFPFSLVARVYEREMVSMMQAYGLAGLPYSPLWGGFLTGKYSREGERPSGSRFSFEQWDGVWNRGLADRAWALHDLVQELAAAKGVTMSQYALAWAAQQPGMTSVVIGPRTVAQLEDNLGAAHVALEADELARIDAAAPPGSVLLDFRR